MDSSPKTRNPSWTREEIILALDTYFKTDVHRLSASDVVIVQLSDTLRKLSAYEQEKRLTTYRNPSGVYMKLMNFYSIEHPNKGLSNASKLDKVIYNEFVSNKKYLNAIANKIKEMVNTHKNVIGDIDDEGFMEGALLEKQHKYKERNSKLVTQKKQQRLKETGYLSCDVCGFIFKDKYGDLGEGYIECHHIVPLSEIHVAKKTNLKDLVLVCSNCHRMLHRKRPWLTVEQLKMLIKS